MALVRGRSLVPIRAFIKETFGEDGWKRTLAELPPPDREIVDGLIVPDAWYERTLHLELAAAIFRLWQKEMPDVGRRLGARAAKHHDKFYLRPFLRLGGPMPLVKRAAGLYREYFQGGEMAVVERRDSGARVSLTDPLSPKTFCSETFLGFCEEIIRLSGRTPVRVRQEVCRHDGADHCEIDLEWS